VVAAEVRKEKGSFGYNAAKDTYEDLLQAGVVDPTKVVRVALESAVSAASTLLTTEAVVVDIPEKDDKKGVSPGMPGGIGEY